jgi:DnaJ-class molecular chaperone
MKKKPPPPMPFEDWLKARPEMQKKTKVECDECFGQGTDECPECGQEVVCRECDGEGFRNVALDIYNEQVKEDQAKWLAYAEATGVAD